MRFKAVVSALAGTLVLANGVFAATHTWTGAVSSLWSNNANWTGGTPAGDPSADLVFPATTRLVSTNDIPGVTYVNSIAFTASGYTINASPGSSVALAGAIRASQSGTNMIDLPISLYGGGDHGVSALDHANSAVVISGVVSGPATENFSFGVSGTLEVTLSGDNTYSGTSFIGRGLSSYGPGAHLTVLGSQPSSTINASSPLGLSGTGTVGTLIASTGTVSPGTTVPGILTVAGNASFGTNDGANLRVRLNGTAAGTQYDQLNVLGSVTINHFYTELKVDLGFVPSIGDSFTILQAGAGITGYFGGRPDGEIFSIDCLNFQIHYTSNAVVLTRVAGGGPPLDSVLIETNGNRTACTTGTDGTVTVTDNGGCNNTHQWGYRTTSGGSITPIPSEGGSSYVIDGTDFPGIGTYFLVETTTPGFGAAVTSNELVVTIIAPPTAAASGSSTICAGGSAALSGSGAATCSWSPANGLSDPNSCSPIASPNGTTIYSLTVSGANGCTSTNAAQVTVTVDGCGSGPVAFYTVPPCRIVDSRQPGGVPALAGGSTTIFSLAGQCGISAGAKAVALNVTVIKPDSDGFLTLYPAGSPRPASSTINYRSGQIRANNATAPLNAAGELAVYCGGGGAYDLLIDVSGYYQ